MSIVRFHHADSAALALDTTGNGPLVWLSDTFSFTPWYTAELAKAISSAGARVRLISSEPLKEPKYFAHKGLKLNPGPLRLGGLMSAAPKAIRPAVRLSEAIANMQTLIFTIRFRRNYSPDIIHLQQLPLLNRGLRLDFVVIRSAKRAGIPVLHTVHNVLPHDSGERSRSIYAELYQSVDHLICHSEPAADSLVTEFNIPSRRITVIPHGPLFSPDHLPTLAERITARKKLNLPPDRPIVLCQGILAEYKGIDVLLNAWELCMLGWRTRHGPPPMLLIAGSGRPSLEAMVRRSESRSGDSLRAHLRYIPTASLPSYYAATDLLVYPYRSITTSGALLTGLSYGKPIVASDLTPFREYLRHAENALLTEPGDAMDLASSLLTLLLGLSQVRKAKNLADADNLYSHLVAQATTNSLSLTGWPEIGRRTLGVYRSLIHG